MSLILPAVFSDNMVLQRRRNAVIWGEEESGTRVTVRFAGQEISTVSNGNGRWELCLNPMEAGGPYTMTVSTEKETITYQNVLVGEVWLAGGQSNMELELQNSDNGKEIIRTTQDDGLRFYYTPKVSYLGEELEKAERENCWMKCEPETTAIWSAAAYYCARRMREELKVPVGILGCNWGGTYAHNWVSRESLLSHGETRHFVEEYEEMVAHQDFDEYLKELEEYRAYYKEWVRRVEACYAADPGIEWQEVLAIAGENRWPGPAGPRFEYRPCGLYETMLKRIAPYTLGGVMYYQGENDENNHRIYYTLLRNLIDVWRGLWRDDKLPFAIVQLPVYRTDTEPTGQGWGGIRRAQQRVCDTVKNTSLTVILDCGEEKNIHPTDKRTVGERLADNILRDFFDKKEQNGNGFRLREYRRAAMEISGRSFPGMRLFFHGEGDGFYRRADRERRGAVQPGEAVAKLKEGALETSGFEISGADGNFVHAKVVLAGEALFVYNETVAEPKYVRYGNDNYFLPEILDKKGRPLMPFWIG